MVKKCAQKGNRIEYFVLYWYCCWLSSTKLPEIRSLNQANYNEYNVKVLAQQNAKKCGQINNEIE